MLTVITFSIFPSQLNTKNLILKKIPKISLYKNHLNESSNIDEVSPTIEFGFVKVRRS